MAGKLLKVVVLSLVVLGLFWVAGGFNKVAKVLLVRFLRAKQGIDASIGNVSLTSLSTVTLDSVVLRSVYEKDCTVLDTKTVDIELAIDRSRGNRIVPVVVSLTDGTIFSRKLSKHFSLRRGAQEQQRTSAQVEESRREPPLEKPVNDHTEVAPSQEALMRQFTMSAMTLDGGTISVNLLIARKEIPVKLKDIHSIFKIKGSRFVIDTLSWKMGPLTPSLENREFDISLIANPDRIKGIPREIGGLLILTDLLLGSPATDGSAP